MGLIKRVLRVIATNFVFFVGFLFIFVIGLAYAIVQPEGLFFKAVFLLIAVGWVLYLIRYFWDLMEKK